jgi:hypothetical protein
MTILPALSIRCSSVVNGGPGSCRSVNGHVTTRHDSLQLHQTLVVSSGSYLEMEGAYSTDGYNISSTA